MEVCWSDACIPRTFYPEIEGFLDIMASYKDTKIKIGREEFLYRGYDVCVNEVWTMAAA